MTWGASERAATTACPGRPSALGGGHGLPPACTALRRRRRPVDLTAIVTVADNGGSTGRLRGEFGVLPPGDLRMALAALCGDDEWGQTWAEVSSTGSPPTGRCTATRSATC